VNVVEAAPMLAAIVRFVFVTGAFALAATSVEAQGTHARCMRAKDKVKCTCFFQSGGYLTNRIGGGRRAAIDSMADVDRYIACMRRHGRHNG
jgi:hypothetical protein